MDVRERLRIHRRTRLRNEDDERIVNTWIGPINTQLYGDSLQSLCRRTSDNIERLKTNMSQTDPCYQYGIKHWHAQTRPKSVMSQTEASEDFKGRWKDANVMFTDVETIQTLDRHTNDNDSLASFSETPLPSNKFCYLCTTMEEHQRHMHLHKIPKRPSTGKIKIKYIAPRPSTKKKEEEDINTSVYDRLYKVDVYTGESGINAKVHITIKGSREELPKTQLKKGRGSMNFIFMRETKETFYLKAPHLGNLEIVTIEHDGLMPTHNWYLEKIIITDVKTEQMWEFECFNWLSLHIKDYRIKRDLIGKQIGNAPREVYCVQIFTGKKTLAGTDANISMTIFGTRGATNKLKFVDHDKSLFEKGQRDSFEVSSKNLGELRRIRVEHDAKGFASGWFLDKVIIHLRDDPKQKYYFIYNGWIGKDIGEGVLYRDIPAKKHVAKETSHGEMTKYIVYVKTGDKRYAGTDADVFIQICGETKMTKKKKLDDEKNNFERGQLDVFQYEDIDVGPIKNIVIGHDNSGPGAGWYLEEVKIRRYLQKKEIVDYLKKTKKEADKIKLKKKQGKGKEDELDELEARMNKLLKSDHRNVSDEELSDENDEVHGKKGKKEKDNKKSQKNKKLAKKEKDSSESSSDASDSEDDHKSKTKDKRNLRMKSGDIVLKVPLYEECVFPCNRWLAVDEDDGLCTRELKVKDKTMYYKN